MRNSRSASQHACFASKYCCIMGEAMSQNVPLEGFRRKVEAVAALSCNGRASLGRRLKQSACGETAKASRLAGISGCEGPKFRYSEILLHGTMPSCHFVGT